MAKSHLENKSIKLLNKLVRTVLKAWQAKPASVGWRWGMPLLFPKATGPRCKIWAVGPWLPPCTFVPFMKSWGSLLNQASGSAIRFWEEVTLGSSSLLCLSDPGEFGWTFHPQHQPPWRSGGKASMWRQESMVSAHQLLTSKTEKVVRQQNDSGGSGVWRRAVKFGSLSNTLAEEIQHSARCSANLKDS